MCRDGGLPFTTLMERWGIEAGYGKRAIGGRWFLGRVGEMGYIGYGGSADRLYLSQWNL